MIEHETGLRSRNFRQTRKPSSPLLHFRFTISSLDSPSFPSGNSWLSCRLQLGAVVFLPIRSGWGGSFPPKCRRLELRPDHFDETHCLLRNFIRPHLRENCASSCSERDSAGRFSFTSHLVLSGQTGCGKHHFLLCYKVGRAQTACLCFLFQVNTNGAVSFNSDLTTYVTADFPINGETYLTPFWADVDPRSVNNNVSLQSGPVNVVSCTF